MVHPNNSEMPEAEFRRLSSEIAAAISQSAELKALASEVVLAVVAARDQALAATTHEREKRAEVAAVVREILAMAAVGKVATGRDASAQWKPIPWRDAIINGAASLIDLLPEDGETSRAQLL